MNSMMEMNRTGTLDVHQQTQITLDVPNDLNVLASLFATLATRQASIRAWRFYSNHRRAMIVLVTEHKNDTSRVLQSCGFECELNPVVVVAQQRHSVSAVKLSAALRAAGINILDSYTCNSPHSGTSWVLRTTDDLRVIRLLEAMNPQPGQPVRVQYDQDAESTEVEIAQLKGGS